MEYLAMFLLSFSLELTGGLYTVNLIRGHKATTVILSAVNSLISWSLVLLIVFDIRLLVPAVFGVVLGTIVTLNIAQKPIK